MRLKFEICSAYLSQCAASYTALFQNHSIIILKTAHNWEAGHMPI